MQEIIYGKDDSENIVAIEYYKTPTTNTVIFKEKDGVVSYELKYYPIIFLNKNKDDNFSIE